MIILTPHRRHKRSQVRQPRMESTSRVQPRADCGLPGWDVGWELALPFQGGGLTAALQVPGGGVEGTYGWEGVGGDDTNGREGQRGPVYLMTLSRQLICW